MTRFVDVDCIRARREPQARAEARWRRELAAGQRRPVGGGRGHVPLARVAAEGGGGPRGRARPGRPRGREELVSAAPSVQDGGGVAERRPGRSSRGASCRWARPKSSGIGNGTRQGAGEDSRRQGACRSPGSGHGTHVWTLATASPLLDFDVAPVSRPADGRGGHAARACRRRPDWRAFDVVERARDGLPAWGLSRHRGRAAGVAADGRPTDRRGSDRGHARARPRGFDRAHEGVDCCKRGSVGG